MIRSRGFGLVLGGVLLGLPGCLAGDRVESWALIEDWSAMLPGHPTNHRLAGVAIGDLDRDDILEIAAVVPTREVAHLLILSGADGAVLRGPLDLEDPGAYPNPGDPAIAVALDPAAPERSQLFVALPYADSRRGVVRALDLATLEERYVIEGDGQQVFGEELVGVPDWDGDGWLDFALVAEGLSGEEGQRITDGFVSVRSGATGKEIARVADGSPTIGAVWPMAAGQAGDRLLVASTIAGEDAPDTLLTAYVIPSAARLWSLRIRTSGVPESGARGGRGASANELLLVGVPHPGHRDGSDDWVQEPGKVVVASSADGRVHRTLDGPAYGFGMSVLGCPDLTGDGIGEIVVGALSGPWMHAGPGTPIALIDGVSGEQLAGTTCDPRKETWGAILLGTDPSGAARTLVTSVYRNDRAELRGFRLEAR